MPAERVLVDTNIFLKLRRSRRYDKVVIFVVLGSVWLALVSLVVAVVTADWDIR